MQLTTLGRSDAIRDYQFHAGGELMKQVVITPTRTGYWLYKVLIDGRVVVVGQAATRELAESEARLA